MKRITRLPKPDPDIHLSSQGYSVARPTMKRQTALKRSSKEIGTLPVIRRLNLIRNLTKRGTKNRKILSKDVDFMKKLYKKEKARKSKTSKTSKKPKKSKKSKSKK